MKVFIIILGIFFISLLVFYIFVNARMNVLSRQRKEDVLNSLSENEKDIIRRYIEACQVSMKDVFTRHGKKK